MEFDSIGNIIFSIGDCFDYLFKLSSNFNSTTLNGRNQNLSFVHSNMNNLMTNWGILMIIFILKNFFRELFSFSNKICSRKFS